MKYLFLMWCSIRGCPVFDNDGWSFKGTWKPYEISSGPDKKMIRQSMYAEKKGDEMEIDFSGTGISIDGNCTVTEVLLMYSLMVSFTVLLIPTIILLINSIRQVCGIFSIFSRGP